MSFDRDPLVVWSHGERTMLGYGGQVHDPGVGPERYRRAAEALGSSGHSLAFASFTFDPEEDGSVILIPEKVVSITARGIPGRPGSSGLTVVSDGVDAWQAGMGAALDALAEGSVEKVVLARQVEIELDSQPHLPTVAERLRVGGLSSYTFLVDGLVGSSPELLVALRGGRLSSLTLAGSANDHRGLDSAKMRREHALAVQSVRRGLEGHVRSFDADSEETLVFGAIHHLGTRLGGEAAPGTTVTDVVAALHPTAAVAGTPTGAALELIREIEPESRDRYAGPVGWLRDTGEGEFALALRCGLVRGRRAVLYAGGGIVEGSDPDEELAETEMKLGPMLSALGG
jgi:menaquinone-specific isochorismate synthase